jgi:hypothetical protein
MEPHHPWRDRVDQPTAARTRHGGCRDADRAELVDARDPALVAEHVHHAGAVQHVDMGALTVEKRKIGSFR